MARLRTSVPLLAALAVLIIVGGIAAHSMTSPAGQSRRIATPYLWSHTPEQSPQDPPPPASVPPTRPALPDIDETKAWASWAVLDVRTGQVTTGGQPGPSTTESMIKIAIAAEYLHELELSDRGPNEYERDLIMRMVRDSDNQAAENLYRWRGSDQMLTKVVTACNLTETRTVPGWWSRTTMTAADAARLGTCIADGKVCSAEWAAWILNEMRQVRGEGRFGIVDTLPDDRGRPLAIKNGWTIRADGWHVNCLAVTAWWTMAVMVRYPTGWDLEYGAGVCAAVAAALNPAAPATALGPTW